MAKDLHILYEDNHLIIVNKAISDIVQGDKTGDESLDKKIKAFIKVRDNKPGNVYLGIPHRLDRPVSGAIIYTKTSKALGRVNESFREGKAKKIYHAIVKEKPNPASGKLENYLRKNEKQNKSYITSEGATGAKLARLEYKLIASSDNYYLIEIKLLTGRHHQIRVQLSNMGFAIKGDLKYGFPRSNKNGGISLHARSISINHPTTGEIIQIEAPYPEGDIFGVF